ncbi:glycosyltransferase family 2 protein [Dyadobacter sp. CY347]|uniref:glycosyltransferase family 2 protein n=1 Tax=Dyadobacter sp. CY347 TaxID=2909336 RepID=UPI001F1ACB89|nr:glycosyltransferase family 2 protein [Dyadobacter sp. CY347]MCF2487522.1 glycosyltransferase family 2 protein [Dyadobacter sp. CY347]
MQTESLEVLFVSQGADLATEIQFKRIRSDFPQVKRLHGTFSLKHLLQLVREAVDQEFFALVNFEEEFPGECVELPLEHSVKLDSYRSLKYVRKSSLNIDYPEMQGTTLSTDMMDIVYLTFDEGIAESNFMTLLKRYPDLKRLHGIHGLTSAFRLSAFLAISEWYVLIDGDNEILPEINLLDLTLPKESGEVKIYFSRNPVNDLEYGYGGVKICPTAHMRRVSNDTIDPICSGTLRPVFDQDRLVVSVTRFNSTPFGAWKAGFRECAMLRANADRLNRTEQNWASKKIETWQGVGADRLNGIWALRGAMDGELFVSNGSSQEQPGLANINNPRWLRSEFERRYPLRLCSVIGDNPALLNHFIRHYQAIGVANFDIIVHVNEPGDSLLQEILDRLQSFDIRPVAFLYGAWNGLKSSQFINKIIAQKPEHWYIIADSDEFHLYPAPPAQLILEAEAKGLSYVTGGLIDRLGPEGELNAVCEEPNLWQQYPLAGFVSFPLMRANPYKIVLCKGDQVLSEGQHGVLVPNQPYPQKSAVQVQVHHFKWTADIAKRLNERREAIRNGIWEGCYLAYGEEIAHVLQHFRDHKGGFDLSEEAFLLATAGNSFDDYVHWAKLSDQLSSWSVLRASPQLGTYKT